MRRDFEKSSLPIVIFARGGSKGIKNKNLQLVNGMSLVARSVASAMRSTHCSEVIVSTDSAHIASEAEHHGAKIHFRSPLAASDNASTEDALSDFLASDIFRETGDDLFGYIQPTSPLILPDDIDAAANKLIQEEDLSCVFLARPTHSFIWKMIDVNLAKGVNHNELEQRLRRQDSPSQYYTESGAFYAIRASHFIETKNRFGKRCSFVEDKSECGFEIDDYRDLTLARAICPTLDLKQVGLDRFENIIIEVSGVEENLPLEQHPLKFADPLVSVFFETIQSKSCSPNVIFFDAKKGVFVDSCFASENFKLEEITVKDLQKLNKDKTLVLIKSTFAYELINKYGKAAMLADYDRNLVSLCLPYVGLDSLSVYTKIRQVGS